VRPEVQRVFMMLERYLPFLQRVGPSEWHNRQDGSTLNYDEVLDRYSDSLPLPIRGGRDPVPVWFRELMESTETHFIQTQRLLRLGSRPRAEQENTQVHTATVADHSIDFMSRVRNSLAESVNQAQDLDRSFPVRFFNTQNPDVDIDAVRRKYQAQQEKRNRLTAAGLITPQMGIMSLPERDLNSLERGFLWLYLDDVDRKLKAFDQLLERIEVLKEIIGSRFLYKSFAADRERGFVFTAPNGRPIPLDALSSGEQHELVLSYELLFMVKSGSLILIDEPELSLHVTWQHRFLEDLNRISKLANLDFIVATHSPQIIHDRWDLAVSLGDDSE
jgi:hypothetical protein